MIQKNKIFKFMAVFGLFLGSVSVANAIPVLGTYNTNSYDVINITVQNAAVVDFTYTGGFSDPALSLFDASGNHIITADDSGGLFFKLTQNLSAGAYSLIISGCCEFINGLPSSVFSISDGFNNNGAYYTSATALSLPAFMTVFNSGRAAAGQNYSFEMTMTGASIAANAVPEPAVVWLLGSGLLGLIGVARRKKL